MITLAQYKADPCGTLSIPYYKAKGMELPPHVKIVHERDYDPDAYAGFFDTPYFRLINRLGRIEAPKSEAFYISTAGENELSIIADIINRSYTDIGITEERLARMRAADVFDRELWVISYDKKSALPAACGIAEFDPETGEASLEWIQTLPEFRRMGAGALIVAELLSRLHGKAGFVTVSGRSFDPNSPEKLYRKCGFSGNDIWHVLREK